MIQLFKRIFSQRIVSQWFINQLLTNNCFQLFKQIIVMQNVFSFVQVTKDGHPALLSSCWYLDHLASGGDWRGYYTCDPHDFSGNDEQKQLVLGGEACMWAEVVDSGNILQRLFLNFKQMRTPR